MGTEKRDIDGRRADLLEAAFTLIAEKGLEGLRTRDIAARAEVNISTLHYYFGTKEALIVAVVDHVRQQFVLMNRAESGSAEPTLRAHLEDAWRGFQASPELSLVLQELSLRGHRDPATRRAFRQLHHAWNQQIETLLQRDIDAGRLRRDLDVQAGARVVTSFIMGAIMQLGVNAKAFDFAEVAGALQRWLAPPARAGAREE